MDLSSLVGRPKPARYEQSDKFMAQLKAEGGIPEKTMRSSASSPSLPRRSPRRAEPTSPGSTALHPIRVPPSVRRKAALVAARAMVQSSPELPPASVDGSHMRTDGVPKRTSPPEHTEMRKQQFFEQNKDLNKAVLEDMFDQFTFLRRKTDKEEYR